MPRIMHETKNYTRQDDAVFVKINKKAPHKYLYLYLLFIFIYACLYAVKLKYTPRGYGEIGGDVKVLFSG